MDGRARSRLSWIAAAALLLGCERGSQRRARSRLSWIVAAALLLGCERGSVRGPTPSADEASALSSSPNDRAQTLLGDGCRLELPAGFVAEPPERGELARFAESGRADAQLLTRVRLLLPTTDAVRVAVDRARFQAAKQLGARPDFELVRDRPFRGHHHAGHLLVYRSRAAAGAATEQHYRLLLPVPGGGSVEAIADSETRLVDALQLPYHEAGIHERWVIAALASVQCGDR